MSDEKPSDLVKALSRLAGSRCGDGTSSLVIREDRETIINGCYDMMMALRSISSHTEGDGWQDISSAPKDGRFIWVYSPAPIENRMALAKWTGGSCWYGVYDFGLRFDGSREGTVVSHWQPLPEPPK